MPSVPVREKIPVQLRFEAFNVLNFQILGNSGGERRAIERERDHEYQQHSAATATLQLGAKVKF